VATGVTGHPWSVDELEPYHIYKRSEERLGQDRYATTLTDMARIPSVFGLVIDHQAINVTSSGNIKDVELNRSGAKWF
jgi:hypothetical protein